MNGFEEKNIQYTFQEIKQIQNDEIINLEVTNDGKIVVLSNISQSKINIYEEETYEEEQEISLNNKVNSFKMYDNKIYCALDTNNDNILIMPLDNPDDKLYLNGHSCSVVGITLSWGWLVSADTQGNVIVWNDNEIKKSNNKDFHFKINTITEINERQSRIAILSFGDQKVKFYDLRYEEMEALAIINDIMGSGFQNNMLKLNSNILAIAGTYIYIIDINSFILTNRINCIYANDCISTSISIIDNRGYFFVGQALTNLYNNDIEKGTLAYYEYDFISPIIPDHNRLIKIGSKENCHRLFITAIRRIDDETVVTGGCDGKIKFWKIRDI